MITGNMSIWHDQKITKECNEILIRKKRVPRHGILAWDAAASEAGVGGHAEGSATASRAASQARSEPRLRLFGDVCTVGKNGEQPGGVVGREQPVRRRHKQSHYGARVFDRRAWRPRPYIKSGP